MISFAEIKNLLGRSEQSREIKHFLSSYQVAQPLPRPMRGDDHINIEINNHPIELRFSIDERESISDGEMFLSTIFLFHKSFGSFKKTTEILPIDITIDMSRDFIKKKMGDPIWSSPILNNDRWIVDGIRMLICFTDDEKSIHQIVFSKA